jgi:hypothetical protein
VAFQLTNICRDVGEDARRGRIYLPQDDLARFGVTPTSLLRAEYSRAFRELMRFEVGRAQEWYARALAQLPEADRKAQRAGLIMAAIYRTLLNELARDGYRVLDRRTSLTPVRKLWIAWKTSRGLVTGTVAVIGGGWAGCAAAVTLAAANIPVVLYETAPVLGGRARRVERDGLRLDNGQHMLLGAYARTLQLMTKVHGERPARAQFVRRPLSIVPFGAMQAGGLTMLARHAPGRLGLLVGLLSARGLSWRERIANIGWFRSLERGGFARPAHEPWRRCCRRCRRASRGCCGSRCASRRSIRPWRPRRRRCSPTYCARHLRAPVTRATS